MRLVNAFLAFLVPFFVSCCLPAFSADQVKLDIPRDVESCVRKLKVSLSKEDQVTLISDSGAKYIALQNSLGLQLRNAWIKAKDSPLRSYFQSKGVNNPDDMSEIVITSLKRDLKHQPIDLAGQLTATANYELRGLTEMLPKAHQDKAISARIWKQPFTSLQGKTLQLEQFRGRTIIISCAGLGDKSLAESLQSLSSKYPSKSFQVVFLLYFADAKQSSSFISNTHINFPVVSGFDALANLLETDLVSSGGLMPKTLVIDKTGKLFATYSGWQANTQKLLLDDVALLMSSK